MRLIAEAPPLVAGAGYTVAAFGAVIAFVWLWVTDKAFRNLVAPILHQLANIGFGGIRGHGAVHPLRFLNGVVNDVEHYLARGMAASERAIVWAIGMLLWTFVDLTFTIVKLAYDTNTAIDNIWARLTHDVPKAIRKTIVKPIKTTVTRVDARTRAQVKHLAARVDHLTARVNRFAHATAGTIASPFPRIGRVEHDLANVKARLKKAEKTIAIGAGAVLTLTALKRLGLGWLKCGNVTKTGKALCGMNPSVLEGLLLDAALLTVAFNLEDFARELQGVTGEAADLIHKLAA